MTSEERFKLSVTRFSARPEPGLSQPMSLHLA